MNPGASFVASKMVIGMIVPEFQNYVITPMVKAVNRVTGRELKSRPRGGYLQVTLCSDVFKSRKESHRKVFLHRITVLLYHGNPDNLPEVNHGDGNKFNNAPTNLEWVTRSGNQQHSHAMGMHKTGEAARMNTTLSANDVREIRALKGEISQPKLAARYGVSQSHISRVQNRTEWKHLA